MILKNLLFGALLLVVLGVWGCTAHSGYYDRYDRGVYGYYGSHDRGPYRVYQQRYYGTYPERYRGSYRGVYPEQYRYYYYRR
jgi:hypothetical protein